VEPRPGTSPVRDLRATGERVTALLDASGAPGAVSRQRAEELVQVVTDLYGAGLERLLDILNDAGRLDAAALEAIVSDDLVASLLVVHGLHPGDTVTRVRAALEAVRPYLGSHGGDVELLGVTDAGVVQLQLLGTCDGCPWSSVTLELAVKEAVEAVAPEVTGFEVRTAETEQRAAGGFVPLSAVDVHAASRSATATPPPPGGWAVLPELGDLGPGELRAVDVAGLAVLVARIGSERYAYRDGCARCGSSLAAALLVRRLGGRKGDAILRCPECGAHFDVRHAGAGLDSSEEHLQPLPLLVRDGLLAVAVPSVGA